MENLFAVMTERQITTSFNSYLPLTCLRNLRYAAVTLLLVIGVGNVWGTDPQIDLRGKTTALTLPLANSETSYTSGDWREVGAPTSSSGNATCTITQSEVNYGTISLTSCGDEKGDYCLQLTKNTGVITTTILSDHGVDITLKWRQGSGGTQTASLTGASNISATKSGKGMSDWSVRTISTTSTPATFTITASSAACGVQYIKITPKVPSCSNTVTPAVGAKTNVSAMTFSSASVATCSSTASDRQVTVTITPSSCYSVPSSTRLSVTGTSAEYASGPTDNGDGTYSFAYQFAKDATGTSTFAASLDTKTTYTVQYNAGSTTYTGGNAISGSHANDTKTCGTSMTLPGTVFTTTGYTQTGWAKTNGGSQSNSLSGSYTANAAQTFYPVWTVNSYTVTWMVNGVAYSAGGSTSVNYGSHVETLPTAPSPASYCGDKFVGWTTAAEYVHGTSPLFTTAGSAPTASGAQTFYAVFADYAE